MDRFIGLPESFVVGAYGPPQASYTLADGTRVIQYTRGQTVNLQGPATTVPVVTNSTGNITLQQGMRTTTGTYNQTATTYVQQPGQVTPVQLSCTVNFTIDREGIVRRWAANGNNCVSQ
jgi:hypothetical protein